MTNTAAVFVTAAPGVAQVSITLWQGITLAITHMGALAVGLFIKSKPKITLSEVEGVAEKAQALVPTAEMLATMAGQPAIAAGIATGDAATVKVVDALLAVHAAAHVTALAAIAAAPAQAEAAKP